ncbi:MAG: DMT family transporter [Candidatus Magasanikbacteria bacterium]|nr:DMT family transporter [Candidatus Magasanikbacteria bacterium]
MRGFLEKIKIARRSAEELVSKYKLAIRSLVLSIPVIALLIPKQAHAADGVFVSLIQGVMSLTDGAGALVTWIVVLYFLTKMLVSIFAGIFLFLINFLIGISQYNTFLGSTIVTIGWSVTRDIANMFLVVALLVIAFATILDFNGYQASALMKNFLAAALLVNFSKMICGLLIDASQVVMMTFVSGFAETAGGNFIRLFKVDNWVQLALGTAGNQLSAASGGTAFTAEYVAKGAAFAANVFSTITANTFTTIISFIGILAVLSLDIILVVRIVTLWFLIVASPLAFVAKVLPVTKGFQSTWWHAFNAQLMVGPVVAFVVWISLASIAVSDQAFSVISAPAFAEVNATGSQVAPSDIAGTKISQWENLALFFTPIVIFILGAKWAVGISGSYAKQITGFANKKLSGYARRGAGFVAKQAWSGKAGIWTQTKKGIKGEGGFTTRGLDLLAQKSPALTSRLPGLARSATARRILPRRLQGAAERAADWTAQKGEGLPETSKKYIGTTGRHAQADRVQALKNAAGVLGFGEQGKKMTAVRDANEHSEANQDHAVHQFHDELTKAASLIGTAQTDAVKQAQANYQANVQKARNDLDHGISAQTDLFKQQGLNSSDALIHEMTKKFNAPRKANGERDITETELAAAVKLVDPKFDKSVKDELERRRKERKKEDPDAADWTDEQELAVKDAITAEKIAAGDGSQSRAVMEQMLKDYRTDKYKLNENVVVGGVVMGRNDGKSAVDLQAEADRTARQQATAAAEATRVATANAAEAAKVENQEIRANVTPIQNAYRGDYNTAMSPADLAAANAKLAQGIGQEVRRALEAGRSDVAVSEHLAQSASLVPEADRANFLSSVTAAARSGNPALDRRVDDMTNVLSTGFASINPAVVVTELKRQWTHRDHGTEEGVQYNLEDLGGKRETVDGKETGPHKFSGIQIANLTAAFNSDPTLVANLAPEAAAHEGVQRALANSAMSSAQMQTMADTIADKIENTEQKKKVMSGVGNAFKHYSPDLNLRREARVIFTLSGPRP